MYVIFVPKDLTQLCITFTVAKSATSGGWRWLYLCNCSVKKSDYYTNNFLWCIIKQRPSNDWPYFETNHIRVLNVCGCRITYAGTHTGIIYYTNNIIIHLALFWSYILVKFIETPLGYGFYLSLLFRLSSFCLFESSMFNRIPLWI